MKTTIDLPDELAREVKALAAREGVPMRSLVEEALRREIARHLSAPAWQPSEQFVFRSGSGLAQEFTGKSWDEIRDFVRQEMYGVEL